MDLNKLEQLDRLRQSGALSEDEFQAQKAQLVGDQETVPVADNTRRNLIIGVGALALLALIIALFAMKPLSVIEPSNSAHSEVTNVTEVAPEESPAPVASASPVPASGFAWATSEDTLGVTAEYLQSKLGPAKQKGNGFLTFEIGGCEVSYYLTRNSVKLFTAQVTGRCQPKVLGKTITNRTTLGSLGQPMNFLVADCLSSCGNAADPTIDLVVPASHASNFIGYRFNGQYDDATSSAMEAWEKSIRTANNLPEFEYSDLLNCADNPPPAAQAAARTITIWSISVGEIPRCSR